MKGSAYPLVTIAIIFSLVGFLYYSFVMKIPSSDLKTRTLPDKAGNVIDPMVYSPREELALTASKVNELERDLERRTQELKTAIERTQPRQDNTEEIKKLQDELRREIARLRQEQIRQPVATTPEIEINAAIAPGSIYNLVSVPALGEDGSSLDFSNGVTDFAQRTYESATSKMQDLSRPATNTIHRSIGGKPKDEVRKYYTINVGATLFNATTLSPIIGRVPKIDTQADTPFRFKLIAGPESFAASGLEVPSEVKNTIWLGWAIGVAENSCVRGWVDTMTFIFHDGRIVTAGKPTRSADNASSRSLGYIGDQWNTPCVEGRYINNASDYLGTRLVASGLESVGDVWGATQFTNRSRFDGVESYFTGDAGEAIAAGMLEGTAGELADYARERQLNAVDIVVLPLGSRVSINIEKQIEIDYDERQRKLRYDQTFNRASNRGFD